MTTRVTRGTLTLGHEDARAYPPFLAQGAGLCAEHPLPDDFTDERGRIESRLARERAKRVCAGCPFKTECDEWAEATGQVGVWGGRDTKERARRRVRHVA